MFFENISEISKGTIKYHSIKEVEFNGIVHVFGTSDEKIDSVVFSQHEQTVQKVKVVHFWKSRFQR